MSILETKNCEDACLEIKDKNYEEALERVKDEINRTGIKCYTSVVLNQLTSDLSELCIVGRGGYGVVYEGKFPSTGEKVAIKKLENKDIVEESETFMAEVRTMSNTNHRNLIKMKGYCFEPKMKALVYEFMENRSLDKILYEPGTSMKWEKLYHIAIEIAHGLMYLHEGSNEKIIHYDIKAGNVLLDNNFSPKIADFGLAKLIKTDASGASTSGMRGTQGYAAPELYSPENRRKVTNKCDVYSFGMLLLEILGKRNINVHKQGEYFPEQVWFSFDSGQLELLLDNIHITMENRESAIILAKVALWCIQYLPDKRPTMKEVWLMLDKQKPVVWEPSKPSPFWVPHTNSMISSMSKYQLSDDDFNGTSSGSNERSNQDPGSISSSLKDNAPTSGNRMSEDDTSGSSGSNISRSNQDPESISSSRKEKTHGSTVSVVQQETQLIYQHIPIEGLDEGTKKKFTFENGDIYVGTWKNGLQHGKGKMWWTNGNKYEGEFKDGSPDGLGIFTHEDGDVYEGAFKKGNREGKGMLTYVNGNKFEGDFKNGIREGRGELHGVDGDKYIGEFKNDTGDGRGTYLYANGDKYEGDFTNGILEGKGEYHYANGDKYIGEYKNGKLDGHGTYFYKNGDKYNGDYKNGFREGKGEFHRADGNKYIGEYKNDKAYGHGSYLWMNGDKYEGDFKNDKADGHGKFTYKNGSYYKGTYKNDFKDGKGIFVKANGEERCGEWIKGIEQ